MTNGWTDNSISYSSPKLGNVSVNASVFLDDGEENDHDANVGLVFSKENYTVGVQYLAVESAGVVAKSIADSDAIRLYGSSKFGKWTLAASVEMIDVPAADEQNYHYVSTTYQHRENLKFALSIGRVDSVSSVADGIGFSIGSFYSFPTKTTLSFIVSDVDLDTGEDRQVIALGISQKISYSID